MATLIDDNDADGQLGKSIWWLLSIRCTSIENKWVFHNVHFLYFLFFFNMESQINLF